MTDAEQITLPSIAFLGAGSMAGAILTGLLKPHVTVTGGIRATNRTAAKAEAMNEHDGVTAWATETTPDANARAVEGAKIVVVAVKPHMVPDLLREIAPVLEPGAIVVSVAVGVTIATFEQLLPETVSVVRSMPNTPATVGRGVTGVAAGTGAGDDELGDVVAMFETVGAVLVIPESQIDALSTISGSGPAYVFYLIEQLTDTAVSKGFTPEQAAVMVNNTFLGASEMLVDSEDPPAELRRRVTSPGGTTERAVAELAKADLKTLFDTATDAALARATELAAG